MNFNLTEICSHGQHSPIGLLYRGLAVPKEQPGSTLAPAVVK